MIGRVVFLGDLCRGDQAVNVARLERLFSPVLKHFEVRSSLHVSEINGNVNLDEWLPVWRESLELSSTSEIATLDLSDAAVIGFEVPDKDLRYLDKNDVPWVNFAIHPLRFLDDLYFDVTSSFTYDLLKHTATAGLIDLCVQSLRARYPVMSTGNGPKTLAIFGQTPIDRSVYFDRDFRRLDNYLPKLDELVGQYENVLLKPHPHLTLPEVDKLIIERYSAHLCTDWDIYKLFITSGMSAACAISSSVLTEVPHFGIHAEYLEPRAKRYGVPISYRSLLDDEDFWSEVFSCPAKAGGQIRISQAVPGNYLRRVFASWGYISDEALMEARLAERQSQLMSPIVGRFEAAMEDRLAQESRRLELAEAKLQQETVRAELAEQRVIQAVTRAQQAEFRAHQERTRAELAEQRAVLADAGTQQAESRAQQAEEWVLSEVRRFEQAETRAQQAESRAQQAEERVLSEVRRFERTEARAQQAEARAQQDAIRAELAEHRASELAAVLDAVRRELDAVQQDSHDRWQLLEAARKELQDVGELNLRHLQLAEARQHQIQALWNSTSWRVTTPLRWLGSLIRNMPVNAKLSHIRKDPVGHLIRYVVLRPKLKSLAKSILKPFPTLEARFRARRTIQIRSSFETYNSNPGGEVSVALSELQRSGVGDSTKLLNESKLQTVDEILERIRRELVQTRLEQ